MWNDLENLTAKELKVIAEEMWLVKWEDFQTNSSIKEMLELIKNQNNDDSSDNPDVDNEPIEDNSLDEDTNLDESLDEDSEYKVITPIKRNGKILNKWDSVEYFKWIEWLIEDWIIEKS